MIQLLISTIIWSATCPEFFKPVSPNEVAIKGFKAIITASTRSDVKQIKLSNPFIDNANYNYLLADYLFFLAEKGIKVDLVVHRDNFKKHETLYRYVGYGDKIKLYYKKKENSNFSTYAIALPTLRQRIPIEILFDEQIINIDDKIVRTRLRHGIDYFSYKVALEAYVKFATN